MEVLKTYLVQVGRWQRYTVLFYMGNTIWYEAQGDSITQVPELTALMMLVNNHLEPIPNLTPYAYDPDTYAAEVKKLKNELGIE